MGLKPGGLRGSLRNVSTGVVPASIVIDTLEAEDIDAESATIRGEIVDMADGYPDAQVYFEWGEDGMGLPESTDLQSLGSVQIFSEELTGLTDDQQYEFRAHGELANVEDEGAVLTFSTEVAIPDSAILHLAADGLGLNDQDSVSIWPDSSGEENDFSATNGGPTYLENRVGGNPAIEFDSVDGIMKADTDIFPHDGDWTLFAVWYSDGPDELNGGIAQYDGTNTGRFCISPYRAADNGAEIRIGDDRNFYDDFLDDFGIHTVRRDGNTVGLRRNGGSFESENLPEDIRQVDTTIGGRGDDDGVLNGEIAELLLTNQAENEETMNEQEARLASKYEFTLS